MAGPAPADSAGASDPYALEPVRNPDGSTSYEPRSQIEREAAGRLRENGTDPRQDKICSLSELRTARLNPHQLKEGNAGTDIYKDSLGNLYIKPKGGIGPGDPLGLNINNKY